MAIQTLTFIFIGVTFVVYIGIAIWARAGTTKDFYIAGGGVPPIANGMATAADWMSQHLSSPWQELFLLSVVMVLST